ncbi:MAG: tetratricopeptide repeat protein [Phycisphaerales bacterium]
MATKVNTKFVIGLLAVMAIAVGAASFLAFRAFSSSGQRQITQGDAAMVRYEQALEAGNAEAASQAIREASSAYERAVGTDRTNLEWLKKWQHALALTVPTSSADAARRYRFHQNIPRSISLITPTDPEPVLEYLALLWERVTTLGASIQDFEFIADETRTLTRQLPENNPDADRARAYEAMVTVQLMARTAVDPQRIERAWELLEAWRESSPDSEQPALWQASWHLAQEELLRDARRAEAADQERDKAQQLITEFIAENPGAIELRFLALELLRRDLAQSVGGSDAREAGVNELIRGVRDILASLRAAPIESVELSWVLQTIQFSRLLNLAEDTQAAIRLLEQLAEQRSDEARPWLALANVHEDTGNWDEATQAAQRMLDLPEPTVSLDSLNWQRYRRIAATIQTDAAIGRWAASAEDDPQRPAFAEDARKKADALAAMLSPQQSYLLADRRGRIALLEMRVGDAVGQLAEAVKGYEAAGETIPPAALRALGQGLESTNNPGEARAVFRRLLEQARANSRDDAYSRFRIASLSTQLRDYRSAMEQYAALSQMLQDPVPALAGIAQTYLAAVDRGDSVTVPGMGTLEEDQLIAEATRIYTELAQRFPDNPAATEPLARLRARAGQGDPAMIAIFTAREQINDNQTEQAIATLRGAIDSGHENPELWIALAEVLSSSGRGEQGLEAAQEGLRLHPGDPQLTRYIEFATTDDPVELAVSGIEDPFQRAITRFRLAAQNGNAQAMDAALEEARRINPESPVLTEIEFELAIDRRDFQKASTIARRAGDKNLDQVGGLLFQGRLEFARGNHAEAVRALEQAVQRLEFNPVAWRWLGNAQLALGRNNEAIASLARASEGRPTDLQIARDYANALVRAGRGAEALAVINDRTGVLRYGQRPADIVEFWLELESRFGGAAGRQRAIEERRSIYRRNPANLGNAAELVSALIDADQWDEARAIIDTIAKDPNTNPAGIAALNARWLHAQQRTDEAIAGFEAFINEDPERASAANAHLAFGDLLAEFGRPDAAAERYRKADELADSDNPEPALKLANLQIRLGAQTLNNAQALRASGAAAQADRADQEARRRLTEAVEAYKSALTMLDPNADPERHARVGIEAVEAQILLGRLDEAESTLGSLSTLPADDLRRLLFRARIASQRGDTRKARQILDQAVQAHPSQPAPFIARARLNAADPALIQDVLADLDRAASLEPGNLEPWQLRINILRARGELTSAITTLREAIRLNPNEDSLSLLLVQTLYSAGRSAEAADEAIALADRRPNDLAIQVQVTSLLQEIGRWSDAARLIDRLRQTDPENAAFAAAWLDARIRSGQRLTPPEAAAALRVVRADPSYSTPSEPVLWSILEARTAEALRASAAERRDDTAATRFQSEARTALARALRRALGDSASLGEWYEAATQILGGQSQAIAFARESNSGELPPMLLALSEQLRFMTTRGDNSAFQAVVDDITALLERFSDDDAVRFQLHKTRGLAHLQMGQSDKAIEDFQQAVRIDDTDIVCLNNTAYILATDKNDVAGALPYAERAAALAPNEPVILDTLGTVYLGMDPPRYEDARAVLQQAAAIADTPDEIVPTQLHLAQVLLGLQLEPQARSAARASRAAMPNASTITKDSYESKLKEIEAALGL